MVKDAHETDTVLGRSLYTVQVQSIISVFHRLSPHLSTLHLPRPLFNLLEFRKNKSFTN